MSILSDRDYKIIELFCRGLTAPEIATRLGCSKPTVYYCLRKPEARTLIDRKRAARSGANDLPSNDMRTATEFATLAALRTFVDLMTNAKSDNIRLQAAQAIMQTSGDLCSILARLPQLSENDWALLRHLASVGFGQPGVTMAKAFIELDNRECAAQESPPESNSEAGSANAT